MSVEAHRHASEMVEPGEQPLDLPAGAVATVLTAVRFGDVRGDNDPLPVGQLFSLHAESAAWVFMRLLRVSCK